MTGFSPSGGSAGPEHLGSLTDLHTTSTVSGCWEDALVLSVLMDLDQNRSAGPV